MLRSLYFPLWLSFLFSGCNLFESVEETRPPDGGATDQGSMLMDVVQGKDLGGAGDVGAALDVSHDLGPLPMTDVGGDLDEIPDMAIAPSDAADTGADTADVAPDLPPVCPVRDLAIGYWSFDTLVAGAYPNEGSAADLNAATPIGVVNSSPGMRGNAADFRGTNGFLNVPNSISMQLDTGAVAFWANAEAYPSNADALHGIVSRDALDLGEGHLAANLRPNGTLSARIQNATSQYYAQYSPFALNTWHHVVVNFGSTGFSLIVDGVLQASDPYTGGIAGFSDSLYIGASSGSRDTGTLNANRYLEGLVDELYLFDQNVTAAQAAELMSAPCL